MTSSRKDCRSGEHRCEPTSRREALYCQGNHSEMTVAQQADVLDLNPSTLSSWYDPQSDKNIPSDRLEQILRLTDDNDALVRYEAQLQGRNVFDVPKTADAKRTAKMLTEFAEFLTALDQRTDGTSPDDAARIAREGNDVMVAIAGEIAAAAIAASTPERKR